MKMHFRISGEEVSDASKDVLIPQPTGYDDNQSGECPDCGGTWYWAEAGHVPGTRKCAECGSFFNFKVVAGRWYLVRERFYR
jgi:hypothetical protein